MVANNSKILTAEQEEKLRQPIDEYVGKIQAQIDALRASASMPYVSRPVTVDGIPCLDGGCSLNIPYRWALEQGYEKIVVVRTRPASFRKKESDRASRLARRFYKSSPALAQAIAGSDARYNRECDELELLREQGRVYVISPSSSTSVMVYWVVTMPPLAAEPPLVCKGTWSETFSRHITTPAACMPV